MRVLLDHCVPRTIRRWVPGHMVRTTREQGWEDEDNGKLLALAATGFDFVLTVDQRMQFEQDPKLLPITVLVLVAPDNRVESLSPHAPHVLGILESKPDKPVFIRIGPNGILPG